SRASRSGGSDPSAPCGASPLSEPCEPCTHRRRIRRMAEATIAVLEGDETGQELLEEALRVLDPEVTGLDVVFERFDLSLETRRETKNQVVYDAATAIREHGLGLKAATITPEGV